MTSIEFEDYDPEEEGDGPPNCMLDNDPACNFPDGLDDYNGLQMCDWLTTDIWPSSGPNDCILDCEQEIVYDEDGNDILNEDGKTKEFRLKAMRFKPLEYLCEGMNVDDVEEIKE